MNIFYYVVVMVLGTVLLVVGVLNYSKRNVPYTKEGGLIGIIGGIIAIHHALAHFVLALVWRDMEKSFLSRFGYYLGVRLLIAAALLLSLWVIGMLRARYHNGGES